MTIVTTSHIYLDERGVAHVEGTHTHVAMIAKDMMAGFSPEQIRVQRPHLTMAQIHAALTYYFDHKAEFDAQIADELKRVNEMHEAAIALGTQASLQELEKRLKDRAQGK